MAVIEYFSITSYSIDRIHEILLQLLLRHISGNALWMVSILPVLNRMEFRSVVSFKTIF